MSKLIQVRNAPRHLKRELVNRAKARGQTLTDYIRESLEREVARPPTDEVFGRIARRPKVILGRPAAAITRQERAAGRPQLWPSWETVGIHMIGPHATELVAKAMPIAGWEAMPAEVTAMIRAHSTISEGLGEALLALQGKPLTPPDDVLRPGPSRDQPTMSGAQLEPAAQEQAPPQAASIEVPGHGGSYYLFKDIDNAEAERFCSGLWAGANFLSRVPDSRITVYINSGGGSVGAGFAMIEMLYKIKRELQIPVDTVILGYAYSMGANVFQAGDHRRMGYFSTMML
ncbi:MAG: ATP-dependent Clp protease proteolytic subunit, partial [Actinobacteria bacterium]|nr:ATP-dependent Clp protease proteolytic subunit [Actinomycetota bacterium]